MNNLTFAASQICHHHVILEQYRKMSEIYEVRATLTIIKIRTALNVGNKRLFII